jgi:hypothetical protein
VGGGINGRDRHKVIQCLKTLLAFLAEKELAPSVDGFTREFCCHGYCAGEFAVLARPVNGVLRAE